MSPTSPAPTPRHAATLSLRNVSKTYPGAAEPAIVDLSLDVGAGEICVLVGPSGCGKTTAMRLINRMIEPTSGEILLDGRSLADRPTAELRRDIGYAIQQVGLFPHRTVAQNIATVPELLGWPKDRIAARVAELLELISLEPALATRYPAQLSGGQRQRVGVARALAADPPLMLMDEPFGAIDPITRERLQNEFLRLQAQVKKTIVFVTHDIDEAIKMGDRIAVLQVGGILAQYATPAELLMAPASGFVEDFVGADRALKRLALERVRDVDLWRVRSVVGDATPTGGEADLDDVLVVDDGGRPLRWRDSRSAPVVIDADEVLRDALSTLLRHGVQYGVVVGAEGRVTGVLSIELISDFLGGQRPGAIDEAPPAGERVD